MNSKGINYTDLVAKLKALYSLCQERGKVEEFKKVFNTYNGKNQAIVQKFCVENNL